MSYREDEFHQDRGLTNLLNVFITRLRLMVTVQMSEDVSFHALPLVLARKAG